MASNSATATGFARDRNMCDGRFKKLALLGKSKLISAFIFFIYYCYIERDTLNTASSQYMTLFRPLHRSIPEPDWPFGFQGRLLEKDFVRSQQERRFLPFCTKVP